MEFFDELFLESAPSRRGLRKWYVGDSSASLGKNDVDGLLNWGKQRRKIERVALNLGDYVR